MIKKLTIVYLIFTGIEAKAQNPDKELIKNTVIEYYWNVMYTNGERKDITAIAEGFHPDFHMYVYYGGEVSVRTRDEWMAILQSNRDKARVKPVKKPRSENSLEFGLIDITGQTAVVKLLISSNGKLKYTDYLSMYKIEDEWKVMTKLFTFHQM